jgi:hypothetical protein
MRIVSLITFSTVPMQWSEYVSGKFVKWSIVQNPLHNAHGNFGLGKNRPGLLPAASTEKMNLISAGAKATAWSGNGVGYNQIKVFVA